MPLCFSEEPVPATAIPLFHDVSLRIGERQILTLASLAIAPGSIVVVMGPSGVGKSVLTDAVFGLLEPTDAIQVAMDGVGLRTRGGVVFQASRGLPHLSVRDNIALVAESPRAAATALAASGLRPRAYPTALSGGESRRLAVQRALASGKDVLWLDEPAAGLDPLRCEELALQLRAIAHERGTSFVIVEHRPEFIAAVADRVVVLAGNGSLQELSFLERQTPTALVDAFRVRVSAAVDATCVDSMDERRATGALRGRATALLRTVGTPLAWWGELARGLASLASFVYPTPKAAWRSFAQSYGMSGVRGIPFFVIVSAIFATIFLLVFQLAVAFVEPTAVVSRMGPHVVVRVAPVLAGMLAAAQAGSAVASWLGQLQYDRQFDALDVLGVSPRAAVIGPTWWGLVAGVWTGIAAFSASMCLVFIGFLRLHDAEQMAVFLEVLQQTPWERALARAALFSTIVASTATAESLRVRAGRRTVAAAISATIVWGTVWVIATEALILAFER